MQWIFWARTWSFLCAQAGGSDGATDPAPAGTYRVQLMLDGKTVGDERVFTITQPAPATTEATPAPSESAQSQGDSQQGEHE